MECSLVISLLPDNGSKLNGLFKSAIRLEEERVLLEPSIYYITAYR